VTEAQTQWLTPREAASYLRCSVSHLLRAARRGDVVGFRCGRGRRFREVDLNRWIEASRDAIQVVPYRPGQRQREGK
jgi:excisionase family DNA binding protein